MRVDLGRAARDQETRSCVRLSSSDPHRVGHGGATPEESKKNAEVGFLESKDGRARVPNGEQLGCGIFDP
jgi:hypothetical protein